MTYGEAIDFLFNSLPVWEKLGVGAYKPGLERVREFAAMLGDPQNRIRTIHVAGTNGKGSTSHMLAAVLQSAGYRTGLFTSPHLVDFRERIRIDGEMINEAAVMEFTQKYRADTVRLGLTFFEMATVMALWWFSRSGVEAAVMETGLGGRLDSTNIITPVVSIITNIGLEHTQYLGRTIAQIAVEKAGIIKPGVPVVIGETHPESAPVFRARAAELGAPVTFAGRAAPDVCAGTALRTCSANPEIPELMAHTPSPAPFALDLAGDYQQKNLATVLAAVGVLRGTFDIGDDALRNGLKNAAATTGLAGRWQIVRRRPFTVLDTAHNAHGLAEVAKQIERQMVGLRRAASGAQLHMVMGFAGDKDLETIIPLLPRNARYILTRAANPRAMPAAELLGQFTSHGIAPRDAEMAETVAEAVGRALALASPDDMVYIGGSNFVVGEALADGRLLKTAQ